MKRSGIVRVFFVAFLLGQTLRGDEHASLPLVAPCAPFIKKMAEEKSFAPEVSENAIRYGNKKLEFDPTGKMNLFVDGKAMASIDFLVCRTDKSSGEKNWFFASDTTKRDMQASQYNAKHGSYAWRHVIPYGTQIAEIEQSLQLQDDGTLLFKIHAEFDDNDAEIKLEPASCVFTMPSVQMQGKQLLVNEKSFVIPEKPAWAMLPFDYKDVINKVVFFPESAADTFSIQPQACGNIRLYADEYAKTANLFRIWQHPKQKQLILALDLRRGIDDSVSDQVQAGIDFRAVDDLRLPDRRHQANLLLNPSFEQGLFGYWLDWNMQKYRGESFWQEMPYLIDAAERQDGDASLNLLAPPRVSGDYRSIGFPLRTFSVPLPAGTYTFSFYAKPSEKGQRVSVWFPNSAWVGVGNKHLPIGFKVGDSSKMAQKVFELSEGWSRYNMTFDVPQSMPVFASIGADSVEHMGRVRIDGLQLESGTETTAFSKPPVTGTLVTARGDNFLSDSQAIEARLSLLAAPLAPGKATVSVRNFFGEDVWGSTLDFTCDNLGHAVIPLNLDGKLGRGIYVITAGYSLNGGASCYETHRLSIMGFLTNTHRLKSMFSEDYGNSMFARNDLFRLLERYRDVGIGATCHLQDWQHSKRFVEILGEYGIETFDVSMGSILRYFTDGDYFSGKKNICLAIKETTGGDIGINDPSILIKDFHLDGSGEPDGAYLEKLRSVAAKVASEHKEVSRWTLCGEFFHKWPFSWWAKDGTPQSAMENYAKLLSAFRDGVKRGNPEAVVYQGSPTNMGVHAGIREIDETLSALNAVGSEKFDLIGCHTYRKRPENPDLDSDTQMLLDVMAKNGYADTPVFYGEGMH